MKAYKLTDKNGRTYNNTRWGENVTHETSGESDLCGPGWLHFYDDPALAVLLNPIHANFREPQLWEAEAEGRITNDHGLKYGCTKLTTVKRIPVPEISINQRVAFAILCAKQICKEPEWTAWADDWLSGKNRAAWAAEAAAARAAEAAAQAAEAAAAAAWAAWAAEAAARAAEAAAEAAAEGRAAEAAAQAAEAATNIDLKAIAQEALTIQ